MPMKHTHYAVPSEDGGWKIIVQTSQETDGPEIERPIAHTPHMSDLTTFHQDTPPTAGA